ncbi:MAG TPA: hypothetical protein VNZ61_05100 [Roseomonas sp.]|nr:hypothetical protein [Roseomonas sp.]
MKTRIFGAALALAVACGAGAAQADEISEGLERARELYEKGDVAAALTETNFALNALQQKRSAAFLELFPAPPSGWTLEEAGDNAGSALAAQMMGGGVMVQRQYAQEGGDGAIEAMIIVDNPLIQALSAMVNNPAMLGSGAKRVRIGSDNAVLERDSGAEEAKMTLVRGNVAVKLEGSGLKSPDILTELMKRFDLRKLQNPQAR